MLSPSKYVSDSEKERHSSEKSAEDPSAECDGGNVRKKRLEIERRLNQERDRLQALEDERIRAEEYERQRLKEEAERRIQMEAERKINEEKERKRLEELAKLQKEENDRKRDAAIARQKREEIERERLEEIRRKEQLEIERRELEEAERKRREKNRYLVRMEYERKIKEENEHKSVAIQLAKQKDDKVRRQSIGSRRKSSDDDNDDRNLLVNEGQEKGIDQGPRSPSFSARSSRNNSDDIHDSRSGHLLTEIDSVNKGPGSIGCGSPVGNIAR
jgi:hypothetical protein